MNDDTWDREPNPSSPEGCTSVEEWLAAGGEITRERESDGVVVTTYQGTKFEFVPDANGGAILPATYLCRLTGVRAHKRSPWNRVTPYTCRHAGCDAYGKHRGMGNAVYCDEHEGER